LTYLDGWIDTIYLNFNTMGFDHTYYLVKNQSDPNDTNPTTLEGLELASQGSFFHFLPHGGMDYLRIEVGVDTETGVGVDYSLKSADIAQVPFNAPTVVYATCCKGGVWMVDMGYERESFVPSAFIHAGAAAYIATPEIQMSCFWEEWPVGVGTMQSSFFWENLAPGKVSLGEAMAEAKWQGREYAYDEWH